MILKQQYSKIVINSIYTYLLIKTLAGLFSLETLIISQHKAYVGSSVNQV